MAVQGVLMRGPNKPRTNRARSLRQIENDAEQMLWLELRARRLNGFKFVRQLPIGPYFADFACRDERLVVEVDGSQHAKSEGDAIRDRYMVANGWSVIRFWNTCVLQDRDSVLETITAIAERRLMNEVRSPDLVFIPAQKGF